MLSLSQKRVSSRDEADELRANGLAFSCGERAAYNHVKNRTISRAKRSAAMPCSAAAALLDLRQWLPLGLMTLYIGETIFLG